MTTLFPSAYRYSRPTFKGSLRPSGAVTCGDTIVYALLSAKGEVVMTILSQPATEKARAEMAELRAYGLLAFEPTLDRAGITI